MLRPMAFWPKRKSQTGSCERSDTTTSRPRRLELRGIVVERTDDLLRLQKDLLDAVAPFVETSGTAAAFVSTEDGRDIQPGLIDYVTRFTAIAAGERFNPHFTIGVASESFLNEMMAEPFRAFAFSPAGASVYQLGTFGSAQKT